MPSHQEPLVSLVSMFLHFVVRDSGPPTCSPGAAAAKCSLVCEHLLLSCLSHGLILWCVRGQGLAS